MNSFKSTSKISLKIPTSFLVKIGFVVFFISIILNASTQEVKAATYSVSRPGNMLGLIGWWTFDGKDMSVNVKDVSGNGNNGNLIGQTATTTVQGKVGQALKFDGVDDSVTVGNISGADGIGAITMGGWIKIATSSSPNPAIITKDWYGTQDQYQLYSGTFYGRWTIVLFNESAQSGIVESGNSTVRYDTWQHVMATYDGAYVRLYLDGVQVGTPAALTGNVRDQNAAVCLGSTADSATTCNYAGNFKLNGALDDVRLYNRALSAAEVKQLYNQGAGVKQTASVANVAGSGLVGWWTFDGKDISNGRINDVSGGNNHGTASGISTSTFYIAGKIAQGLNFDGVDDYVNVGDIAGADGIATITISGWVKFTSSSGGGNVLYKGQSGFDAWQLYRTGFGRYAFGVSNAVPTVVYALSDSTFEDTKWHHVVGVYDGANVYVYVDGVSADSSANPLTGNIRDRSEPICVGGGYGGGCMGNLNGALDDVRIYNRALSSTEVKQLYNQGAGTKQSASGSGVSSSGLVGWWTFDGSKMSSNVSDSSGNGNHGVLLGQTSTSTVSGRIGQGLFLDGTDDNVKILTDVGDNTSALTVSAWIKLVKTDTDAVETYVSKTKTQPTDMGMWSLARGIDDKFLFMLNVAAIDRSATAAGVTMDTKWHHVIGVYDGVSMTIYVDGIAGAPTNITGSVFDSSPALCFGAISNFVGSSCNNSTVDGVSLDDVRIYNRALSAVEVKQLYNMGR